MTKSVYRIDPEVDHLVAIREDGAGRRHLVMEIDADLSGGRRKACEVTIIRTSPDGTRVVEGPSRKKKQSRMLRPVEKLTRKSARRAICFMQDYLYLHERANKKKKNGWLREYPKNFRKAIRRQAD